ncbi:hypothetical protein MTF65_02710 [Streptomyces sp. APSN-46.1]|uniref:hypothetical protein n=1 Tax=Streptomyces sp. APSN-46.1 TaxID=2929049 RepID=UPI001FB4FF32|nr:hypothetical protein [Streptomyces sp. APSN-46.1]MCJ1676285.1 hypothetical protein [Streptomyces sp. APSN-46.1]
MTTTWSVPGGGERVTATTLCEIEAADGTTHPAEQIWTPGEDAKAYGFLAHGGAVIEDMRGTLTSDTSDTSDTSEARIQLAAILQQVSNGLLKDA